MSQHLHVESHRHINLHTNIAPQKLVKKGIFTVRSTLVSKYSTWPVTFIILPPYGAFLHTIGPNLFVLQTVLFYSLFTAACQMPGWLVERRGNTVVSGPSLFSVHHDWNPFFKLIDSSTKCQKIMKKAHK